MSLSGDVLKILGVSFSNSLLVVKNLGSGTRPPGWDPSHGILDKVLPSCLGFLTQLFWKLNEINHADVKQCGMCEYSMYVSYYCFSCLIYCKPSQEQVRKE